MPPPVAKFGAKPPPIGTMAFEAMGPRAFLARNQFGDADPDRFGVSVESGPYIDPHDAYRRVPFFRIWYFWCRFRLYDRIGLVSYRASFCALSMREMASFRRSRELVSRTSPCIYLKGVLFFCPRCGFGPIDISLWRGRLIRLVVNRSPVHSYR